MIAVILAAGRGSRLNEYTEELPKSLLPLNKDKTILDHNLSLLTDIGIDRKIIVTGYEKERIETHVAKMSGISCIYNPFWNYCNVLGSLYMALPYIKEEFLFLHADTLVGKKGWEKMLSMTGDMVLPFKEKKCGQEEMKVRVGEDGSLLEINKTMNPSVANGEFLGIAKFKKEMVNLFQEEAESLFNKGNLNYYMEAVISNTIDYDIKINTFDIGDIPFVEIDFEEDYIQAKKIFYKN